MLTTGVSRSGNGLFGPVLHGLSPSTHVADLPGGRKKFEPVEHYLLPGSRHKRHSGRPLDLSMDILEPLLCGG